MVRHRLSSSNFCHVSLSSLCERASKMIVNYLRICVVGCYAKELLKLNVIYVIASAFFASAVEWVWAFFRNMLLSHIWPLNVANNALFLGAKKYGLLLSKRKIHVTFTKFNCVSYLRQKSSLKIIIVDSKRQK